jgi:hypothetical protein
VSGYIAYHLTLHEKWRATVSAMTNVQQSTDWGGRRHVVSVYIAYQLTLHEKWHGREKTH